MRADEIMTEDVVTVRATQSIADAIEVLANKDIRHLPVLGDAGQLVGMLSDRDLRSLGIRLALDGAALQRAQEHLRRPVSSIMSGGTATVSPETELPELIDALLDNKVGVLPVVDEESDSLLGIVSYVDVLRALRDVAAGE